ncbi:hypothetical protein PSN45_000253 [Yamadazyma tenuis]|uniref:Negative transcriptional regulator n=1 Tax=Candida tenuis (strain ATCC 10573 / BCRC 21748 / CBS 615 / JCM 9827 / NBRC 10315 / NRRL Y-1498 / VKM Y-70) TaxID=590646 RepID=G3BBM7_CANTC|nr:negative transcriptional regulator [Yamadazyma tenuis ATCC 10573]XP_006688739.1 uncharacterized protein CANTEDRAFT_115039 [Yamadazyma tenuis ATCC 10573]EGV62568.1 negative transcriptional regulator [Yamadazyma tenuis ATCC 10573]EGV62569.1 hypothetical protein CANTEDRAFT_115039 [Yamadazyma tenuis ATCC 10573]WEJ92797.1 hypothetical protein PSN45_000253 [Yamadazyma tenuis]
MYIPDKYDAPEWEQQKSIIKEYPLAVLITSTEDGIIANHIPFNLVERDGKKILQAHLAKVNHQLPSLKDNDKVCVVFSSSDAYVTPSYYKTKEETHKVVPTWLFAAVHCYGSSTLIDDFDFIKKQHESLTDQEEAGREKPWAIDEAPEKYYKIMQKAIIGLEIEITKIEGKFKFEQKMRREDIDGVITGLAQDNIPRVSKFVEDSNKA